MRKQISRLSPHQNAKVMAVLMTIGMAVMMLPMMLVTFFAVPATDPDGNPVNLPYVAFVAMPLGYLVFSYLFMVVGCWLYNLMYRVIGGFEFDTDEV